LKIKVITQELKAGLFFNKYTYSYFSVKMFAIKFYMQIFFYIPIFFIYFLSYSVAFLFVEIGYIFECLCYFSKESLNYYDDFLKSKKFEKKKII
jgi:hypothetical protein